MEYWEMDIWKVNQFNFLNEEVEQFTSRWNQKMVNIRSLATWNKKPLNNVYETWADYIFSFSLGHGDGLLVWVKYIHG